MQDNVTNILKAIADPTRREIFHALIFAATALPITHISNQFEITRQGITKHIKTLEEAVGRDKFDDFLNKYFADHEFQTLTTEDFIAYLNTNLLEPNKVDFNVDDWVYGKGIPDNCVKIESDKLKSWLNSLTKPNNR